MKSVETDSVLNVCCLCWQVREPTRNLHNSEPNGNEAACFVCSKDKWSKVSYTTSASGLSRMNKMHLGGHLHSELSTLIGSSKRHVNAGVKEAACFVCVFLSIPFAHILPSFSILWSFSCLPVSSIVFLCHFIFFSPSCYFSIYYYDYSSA